MDGAMGMSEISCVDCVDCKEKRAEVGALETTEKTTIWPPAGSCSLPDLVEFHPVPVCLSTQQRSRGPVCILEFFFSSAPQLPTVLASLNSSACLHN